MLNARLDDSQSGIKFARRNINNLRYSDDTTFNSRKRQKTKIMAYSPKKWKQWQILFSWAPKSLQMVTAAMKLLSR